MEERALPGFTFNPVPITDVQSGSTEVDGLLPVTKTIYDHSTFASPVLHLRHVVDPGFGHLYREVGERLPQMLRFLYPATEELGLPVAERNRPPRAWDDRPPIVPTPATAALGR